jgi:hypothetical protein
MRALAEEASLVRASPCSMALSSDRSAKNS